MFKTKQFSLVVVVPEKQWLDYEEFIDVDANPDDIFATGTHAGPSRTHASFRPSHSPSPSLSYVTHAAASRSPTPGPSSAAIHRDSSTPLDNIDSDITSSGILKQPTGVTSITHTSFSRGGTSKCRHQQSSLSSSELSPLQNTQAPSHSLSTLAFSSPNRDELRAALQSGGTADIDLNQGMLLEQYRLP